jgi:hypothetical protein
MSEVAQETRQEFWQPPSLAVAEAQLVPEALPAMAEACPGCGSEFLLGSRFCHNCGRRRPEAISGSANADAAAIAKLWEQAVGWVKSVAATIHPNRVNFPDWLHYLHFHEIKRWVGLPTPSLIAFLVGLGCIAGALLAGMLTAKTLVDWQAIQFYRAEWLLAATAAFVAGILLKRPSRD